MQSMINWCLGIIKMKCVSFFTETNIDETELKDALASAQQMVLNLESKR